MIVHLKEELKIEAVRKSNVIRVSYRSEDPDLATKIVGTLTNQYLEKRSQMYQSPQALSFFEEQMVTAEKVLSESEAALEEYLASCRHHHGGGRRRVGPTCDTEGPHYGAALAGPK